MGGGQSMNTSGESDKRLIGDMAHEIQELKDRLKDVTTENQKLHAIVANGGRTEDEVKEALKGSARASMVQKLHKKNSQHRTSVIGKGVAEANKKAGIAGNAKAGVRRGEVSAEVWSSPDAGAEYVKSSFPKRDEIRKLLEKVVNENILFQGLRSEEKEEVVGAFFQTEFNAGSTVIEQGAVGDNFYVIESGELEIRVSVNGMPASAVGSLRQEQSFGELALMYNVPRAATITGKTDGKLWALSRGTFRNIHLHHKALRKKRFEEYLKGVPLFESLSQREIAQIATAVDECEHETGYTIIRQGEQGDNFYIIEEGKVGFYKTGESGEREKMGEGNPGCFFGEKALLQCDTRACTVEALTPVKVLTMARHDFNDLLGSLKDRFEGKSDKPDQASSANNGAMVDHAEYIAIPKAELVEHQTLGCGAFGRVKLVRWTKATGNAPDTFALKCLIKEDIVNNNLQDHVINERNVMMQLDHPFILKLHNTYQDKRYVYFLLELCLGGELFSFLRKAGRFTEKAGRFYASAVVSAFKEMHAHLIVYRDLKPENLMLDTEGYLKVVDFGLAKRVEDRTWTLCGTPDYLAPEIILSKGHDKAVDYWALGVFIYEMCAGFVPFYADDPMDVYQMILQGDLKFPSHFSKQCMYLIQKLMNPNQSKRLGNVKGGVDDIIKHKWFSGYSWDDLLARKMSPPIKPHVKSNDDTSNFDVYPDENAVAPETDWVADWEEASSH